MQIARESSSRECAKLQASVAGVIAARFTKTGISLANAFIIYTSWEHADLRAHLRELRQAYTLATKYQNILSLTTIGDMLNAALLYNERCHYDSDGEWMKCQFEMCGFTLRVLKERVTNQEQREAAAKMGLKRMIEATCVMIGA